MIKSYTRFWAFSTEELGRMVMEEGKQGLVLTEVKVVDDERYVATLKEVE